MAAMTRWTPILLLALTYLQISYVSAASNKLPPLPAAHLENAHQLTEDNWDEKVGKGMWLVEHYSPACGHCRHFAPTYERLTNDFKKYETSRGLSLAQVNCQAQGDLCNKNEIRFYPALKLYQDGQDLGLYSGDRSYNHLSSYLHNHSSIYMRTLSHSLSASSSSDQLTLGGGEAQHGAGGGLNPDGEMLEVDGDGLEKLKEEGAVFVKFYAPWCGHCKQLAPTWIELAKSLQGKVNVAAVNCVAHAGACKAAGISGYPTLQLFSKGSVVAYNKARKLEAMAAFATGSVSSAEVKHIEAVDLPGIRAKHDIYFVLVQSYGSSGSDLRTLKEAVPPELAGIPFFESYDPEILLPAQIDVQESHPSVLLCYKDNQTTPVASLPLPASASDITTFLLSHKWPTIIELNPDTYLELTKSPTRALLLLTALKKTGRPQAELQVELEKLKTISRAWRKGGRKFVQPVWFVWVDSVKNGKWLKQDYGISSSELPAVRLVDPPLNEYYDITIEKTPLVFEGESIFSTLEGAYQHFLAPKFVETRLERGSRGLSVFFSKAHEMVMTHPTVSVICFGLAIFLASIGLARACMMNSGEDKSLRLD